MRRPEQLIQIGIFNHLRSWMAYQKHKKFLVFHCPNGGGRSKIEAGILKQMGVMAGVSDIILLMQGGKTAFIELKVKSFRMCKRGKNKGKQVEDVTEMQPSQERFIEEATALGFPCHVVEATDIRDGLNQVLKIMEGYGVL